MRPVAVPKLTDYPRLRSHTRKMDSGRVHTYYFYDMRGTGEKDLPLGKDYDTAVKRWDELHNGKAKTAGTIEEAFAEWESKVLPTYTNKNTRDGYVKALRHLREPFGRAGFAGVRMKHLVGYLDKRSGKVQANRELSLFQVVWNYARIRGFTELPWPAAGMERSKWKNTERPREVEVTDAMFKAVYAQADQLLRDAMDLASATGMRVTDVRTIPLPKGDTLRLKASKTGKKADFDISLSQVLPGLLARRRDNREAEHLMLLAGPRRTPVSERQLSDRFAAARTAAAIYAYEADDKELGAALEGMVLRDCRKYAADLAEDALEAQKLLQHGSPITTMRHYRTKADRAKPVR